LNSARRPAGLVDSMVGDPTAPHHLLATGTWRNSAMHGHYGEDKVAS
jgi:hypothetical protein